MKIRIDISDRLYALASRLVNSFAKPTFEKGEVVIIIKADNPDVAFQILPPTVRDSEGNVIPNASLTYETVSDNPGAVRINPSDNPLAGTVTFGSPNPDGSPAFANINVSVKSGDKLLGSFGQQFTVTVGDPSEILGGSISFDGLADS